MRIKKELYSIQQENQNKNLEKRDLITFRTKKAIEVKQGKLSIEKEKCTKRMNTSDNHKNGSGTSPNKQIISNLAYQNQCHFPPTDEIEKESFI